MKALKLTHPEYAGIFGRLALLLRSGIPLGDGLRLLGEEEKDGSLAAVLSAMAEQLDAGEYLSDAMDKAECFAAADTGMIRAAEAAGNMEETLASLGTYHERQERLRGVIRRSLTYPAVLGAVMLAVLVLLVTEVLPVFDSVYRSLGTGISGPAAGLLAFGNALGAVLPYIEIVLAAAAVAAAVTALIPRASDAVRAFFRRRFGDRGILRQMNNARMAQALSAALRSGLPVEEALLLAEGLMSDCPGAQQRCRDCRDMLLEGHELTQALERTELFTPADCRMLSVGQRTGNLEEVTDRLALRMAEDAENALEERILRIEPALILITSILVGILLLTVMLPLIDIMNAIG